MTQYPLGTNDQELARLTFQQEVWGDVTNAFLDTTCVRPGARVLDLGCGPGLVTIELARRVGKSGAVVALDESARWTEHVEQQVRARDLTQVRVMRARIEEAQLEPESFDLVFARWVWSFVPDPARSMSHVARWLRRGGMLALQDYNHEGVSVFPESEGFRAVVRATRALYTQMGGDPWIAGRVPALFREAGLETLSITPTVLSGGPQSGVFRWAGLFFPHFSQVMLDKGLLSADERALFLSEWAEREANPDALFFSPIVVAALGRRPM